MAEIKKIYGFTTQMPAPIYETDRFRVLDAEISAKLSLLEDQYTTPVVEIEVPAGLNTELGILIPAPELRNFGMLLIALSNDLETMLDKEKYVKTLKEQLRQNGEQSLLKILDRYHNEKV